MDVEIEHKHSFRFYTVTLPTCIKNAWWFCEPSSYYLKTVRLWNSVDIPGDIMDQDNHQILYMLVYNFH